MVEPKQEKEREHLVLYLIAASIVLTAIILGVWLEKQRFAAIKDQVEMESQVAELRLLAEHSQ